MSKLDQFCAVYEKHLTDCVREKPTLYAYPVETVPAVMTRMRPAIASGNANIESPAFHRTCRELGIKHTRKAIREFLGGAA